MPTRDAVISAKGAHPKGLGSSVSTGVLPFRRTSCGDRRRPLRCGALLSPLFLALLLAGAVPASASPDPVSTAPADSLEWRVLPEESALTVVTRRAGAMARFAHDHLIHASAYAAELTLDPEDPAGAAFQVEVEVAGLIPDDPEMRARVEARLIELEILEEAFQSIGEGDREDVRGEMLDRDQLHWEAHPTLQARLQSLEPTDDEAFPWEGIVALTLRGEIREAPILLRMEREGDRIRVEGHGSFHFTDFGIQPYRAFMGTVRNQDRFYLYLDLVAEPDR